MRREELRIVRQRRIGAQLMRNLGMFVEVAVVEAPDRPLGQRGRSDRAGERESRESCK